jgi:hypothetical protein
VYCLLVVAIAFLSRPPTLKLTYCVVQKLGSIIPLAVFQRLKVVDPACGSGIFLRAFLELQNEALLEARTTESVAATFDNVVGVDIDKNACHAARLSLSLLSLVLLDDEVRDVTVLNESALAFYAEEGTGRHFVSFRQGCVTRCGSE